MSWFKSDDKLHDHRKTRKALRTPEKRRDAAAIGLWALAGSWCADNLTDGFVPTDELDRWDDDGEALAERLVAAGLWHPETVDGEVGYRFHEWADYQPTRAQVLAKREGARERMRRVRANGERTESERAGEVRPTPSRPVPTRPDPVVVDAGATPRRVDNLGLTDDDLDRIGATINGDREYARRVAAEVLDRAGETVRKPLAYVLRAIAAEPDRYRRARGNPRPGQAGECGRHPGQWADTCRSCAADRKAGA